MKRTLVVALAAVFVSAPGFALAAEGDQQSSRTERMQQWAADRETVLDAKLAGMKAGLALTADQEKLWGPFQSAVEDAAKPLYNSLDESQKHKFGTLGRMLMPERSRFAMDMMHHHVGERDRDGAE
jgi:hypothetical protein